MQTAYVSAIHACLKCICNGDDTLQYPSGPLQGCCWLGHAWPAMSLVTVSTGKHCQKWYLGKAGRDWLFMW